MTDRVQPTLDGAAESRQVAAVIALAGATGESSGWVVPAANDPRNIATDDVDIDETALNAFAESHSASSFDVTVDAGQAYLGGVWLARDVSTTVTVSASTNNQTIYVGPDVSVSNGIIIGLSGAFNADDPKIPLWDIDADGSGVTTATDRRNLDDHRIDNAHVDALKNLAAGDAFGGYPIGSGDIATDAVTASEILDGAVGTAEIATGAITSTEISDGSVTSTDISDGTITRADLAFDPDSPIFGGGQNGSITRSSGGNENGILQTTNYTLESGNTRSVTTGYLVIQAQQYIEINGTLDGSGGAANGGAGGTGGSLNGSAGGNGQMAPNQLGGSGGGSGISEDEGNGGAGGDGDTGSPKWSDLMDISGVVWSILSQFHSGVTTAGAGGGGGGAGRANSFGQTSSGDGNPGSAPGGGGGGGNDRDHVETTDGGDGGAGGALIVLIAPEIRGSGSVFADGADGQDGNNGTEVGGGGGGGGSGGTLVFMGEYNASFSRSVQKGVGGSGGTGNSANGAAGADGNDGHQIIIDTA